MMRMTAKVTEMGRRVVYGLMHRYAFEDGPDSGSYWCCDGARLDPDGCPVRRFLSSDWSVIQRFLRGDV